MQANVIGRVRNTHLPLNHALLPLYEAIINSIDAIEDSGHELSDSYIDIFILRQYPTVIADNEDNQDIQNPISGFEIYDNGIGFTEKNFESFNEADTQFKSQRGGKGVGRFLWLKAFEKVEIKSSFLVNKRIEQRIFTFSLASPDGISNHQLITNPEVSDVQTLVRLLGFREKYERNVPHTPHTIAQRIVEHCLEYFVLGKMPRVRLHDQNLNDPISLDSIFENLVATKDIVTLKIKRKKFDLIHFFLHPQPDLKHQICYCGNRRVVETDKLEGKVPNLPPTLPGENDESFIYAGYVSSTYLDEHINQQRTGFEEMPEGGFDFPNELAWDDITSKVLAACQEVLHPFTEAVRVHKEKRIREYVSNSAPEYRHIIKNHPDELLNIPYQVSDEKLHMELYEISRKIEIELKTEASELLEDGLLSGDNELLPEQWDELSRFWEEWNDVGKANLAKYIVHRKIILTFLEKALQLQGNGDYAREDAIHKIIFPLRSTSDEITYDQHNLWIIDEKLAYHQYLASDLPLSQSNIVDSDSRLRPDLLITFDRAFAVVDDEPPYNSGIVIFEFKRPMRDDYKANENPIQQTLKYVEEIKNGRTVDKNGRVLNIPPATPFYCYIMSDLTPKLIDQAKYASLHPTPDAGGYFGYNDVVGAYIEVIGFTKLIQDAKKRNRVLFNKLNLPY